MKYYFILLFSILTGNAFCQTENSGENKENTANTTVENMVSREQIANQQDLKLKKVNRTESKELLIKAEELELITPVVNTNTKNSKNDY